MQRFVRSTQIWLSLLFISGFLLRPLPVAAQSHGDTPADESAQIALFLPFASAEASTGQPKANPLTVTVTPDVSRAITQTIPIEGGSFTVTATNGTRYTLTFPADALLSDEEIVMTPLAAVAGMPLSAGLVAGVQLAPDGLRLFQPATLTIEGAPAFDTALQAVGFGYQADGQEFHLRPISQSGNSYALTLWHFSGYGLSAGTNEEIMTQVLQNTPTGPDDAMVQQQAANADSPEPMQRFFEDSLLDYLTRGRGGDMKALDSAAFYFPWWVEIVTEMGLEEEFAETIATGWKHLFIGLGNAIDFGYMDCKNGDASQVVKIIRWVRITRSLPVGPRREWISDNYLNNTAKQKALGCATFTMDFDSTLVREVPGVPDLGMAHDSHLRAENIRVQFDLNGRLVAPSQAALNYVSFNLAGSMPGCTPEKQTTNATFNLVNGRINLNYGWGETPKLNFKFNPGHPTEKIVHHCPNNFKPTFEPHFWHIGFWRMHWSEARVAEGVLEFDQWRFVGKRLYAELIIERPVLEGALYHGGTTWMVLAHAPE